MRNFLVIFWGNLILPRGRIKLPPTLLVGPLLQAILLFSPVISPPVAYAQLIPAGAALVIDTAALSREALRWQSIERYWERLVNGTYTEVPADIFNLYDDTIDLTNTIRNSIITDAFRDLYNQPRLDAGLITQEDLDRRHTQGDENLQKLKEINFNVQTRARAYNNIAGEIENNRSAAGQLQFVNKILNTTNESIGDLILITNYANELELQRRREQEIEAEYARQISEIDPDDLNFGTPVDPAEYRRELLPANSYRGIQ